MIRFNISTLCTEYQLSVRCNAHKLGKEGVYQRVISMGNDCGSHTDLAFHIREPPYSTVQMPHVCRFQHLQWHIHPVFQHFQIVFQQHLYIIFLPRNLLHRDGIRGFAVELLLIDIQSYTDNGIGYTPSHQGVLHQYA